MFPDDLLTILHRRPFEPFRIQVSDGTTYDVYHPELVMVGEGAIIVGIQAAGKDIPVYRRYETVALSHIVKLLPLAAQPTSGNGEK